MTSHREDPEVRQSILDDIEICKMHFDRTMLYLRSIDCRSLTPELKQKLDTLFREIERTNGEFSAKAIKFLDDLEK